MTLPTSWPTQLRSWATMRRGEGHRYFINILISCRTLIKRILHDPTNKQLMIDTTYGLSIDKLHLCLVGTPYPSHEFSPICLSLTTNENTRSAGQVLQWVKVHHEGAVKAVMADGALCLRCWPTTASTKTLGRSPCSGRNGLERCPKKSKTRR